MSDLISRQAAIDRIDKQREHLQPDIYPQDKIGDAAYRVCAEFIEQLPSAQPEQLVSESGSLVKGLVKDCIDRQDAIDALNICYANIELDHDRPVNCYEGMLYTAIKMALDRLPSAQPELIRCMDCKYKKVYAFPPKYDERDYCEKHEKVVDVADFCSFAERRKE